MEPEKCSFCEETTDRTSDGKLPDGWGKAKGNVLDESFDITFCPKHRKEAEGKLDIIFKRIRRGGSGRVVHLRSPRVRKKGGYYTQKGV